MACTSMTKDFSAIISASNFIESAYNFANEKQKYYQCNLDTLQKPASLKYLSDSMVVTDSISKFGKLELDGFVCVNYFIEHFNLKFYFYFFLVTKIIDSIKWFIIFCK